MKSIISKIALSLSLVLILSACSDNRTGDENSNNQTGNSTGNENNNQTGNGNNQTNRNVDKFGYDCNLKVVNSFTLPPCPNQELNDKTLLGIDSNDNGVRDDVERWLIMRYKDYHVIATHIGFQVGRAHQFMLANPDKPELSRQKINGAQDCNWYFKSSAKRRNEPILIDHDISTYNKRFDTVRLNTEARIRAYLAYDRKLSGGVYTLVAGIDEERAACDFNINALLKEFPVDNSTVGK
ncbi:MAG: hypothetical protein LBG67_02045 [Campylobacteraceae bacterium]|jgi:hypothetical protein|nr:hypothetical protein [Campylobacteraceae bacterium]